MARAGIRTAAWVLLAISVGGVGYLAGSSRQIQASLKMLQTEAGGNLIQRIETLSLLRMGDVPGAINHLESEADWLTVTISKNPGAEQRALAYMKTYLSVAPLTPDRDRAVSAALTGVPVLEPSKCDTGLKALLLSAKPATRD
jgi:hypothetical protein